MKVKSSLDEIMTDVKIRYIIKMTCIESVQNNIEGLKNRYSGQVYLRVKFIFKEFEKAHSDAHFYISQNSKKKLTDL